MKNFLFLIGIALIIYSCNQKQSKSTFEPGNTKKIQKVKVTNRITLNGYTYKEADTMVRAFLKKKGVYNRLTRTNIWFSKKYVDSLVDMLDKERTDDISKYKSEKVDGIRIYFAKDKYNKLNFILVSTRGKDRDTIHRDYFEHNSPFLSSEIANGSIDHGKDKGAALYKLIHFCPINKCNIAGKHYVNCSTAKKWVKNHKPTNGKDTINTTSEWFELELLHEIRNDLKKTLSNKNLDGIRIYFTRKTEKDKKHLLRHNLIIVTTEAKAGGIHKDYFDCNENAFFNANDNGEQCRNNCDGTSWADVKSVDEK